MSSGILLIDKPTGKTSFFLVKVLRNITGIQKIGHAGTLDPLATGVMVMLVGKGATTLSNQLIGHDKIYEMTILLGKQTTTLDIDGEVINESSIVPTLEEISEKIQLFQGSTTQIPPMFSAKKIGGVKLYDLARKGVEIERQPINVWMKIDIIEYKYPNLKLCVHCTSGTYMRSLSDDLGKILGCYGTISQLRRVKSGPFEIKDCIKLEELEKNNIHLRRIDDTCKQYSFST